MGCTPRNGAFSVGLVAASQIEEDTSSEPTSTIRPCATFTATWSLRATPEIKWDLGSGRLQPFVWTGVGLAYQATYPGPVSSATV